MGICDKDSQLASFLIGLSFCRLCGFLLACIGWCLCVSTTSSGQWRQWHFEKSTKLHSDVVWIGIWDVCYDTSVGTDYHERICKQFEGHHLFLPKEIFFAQDLLTLCTVVHSVALVFFFSAYWSIIRDKGKRDISFTFFTTGGLLSLTSGIIVLIPVTWNMLSVLNNESIDFPGTFGIPSPPKSQRIGKAIPLGFLSSGSLMMSGLLFLGNRCLRHKKIHPLDIEESSEIFNRRDSSACPHCGSFMNVAASSHCEGSRAKKKQSKSEEAFQIPMGPIPQQRVAV